MLNFHVTTTEKILQAALSSTISMGGIFAANGDGMFVSFHFDFDEVDVVVVAGDVHVDVVVVFDVFWRSILIIPPSFGWLGDDFDDVDKVAGIIDGVGVVEVGIEEVGVGVSDDILKWVYYGQHSYALKFLWRDQEFLPKLYFFWFDP